MATKIVTKNSSTASAVPTASDLVQGELAVNVADKRLFTEDNGGSIVELGTNPSSLTVSGNIDVDGTTNLDVVDIDGAVDMASTLTVAGEITANGGIALGDNDKATFGASDDLQIYHDGLNSYIKDIGTGSLKIAGADVEITTVGGNKYFSGSVNVATLFHTNNPKLATTSGGIQVTGDISNASGDLTLDVAGNINLDADGGEFRFKDGGTLYATAYQGGGGSFYLASAVQDKDLIFQGNDGGSTITALTLDMSAAGAATFNAGVTIPDYVIHDGNTATKFGFGSANTMNFISNGSDRLTIANSYAVFNEAGTDYDFRVESVNSDRALFVQGSDGQVNITNSLMVGATTAPSAKLQAQVNNTATPDQIATDSNAVLLLENTNASGSAGIRLRGGNGAGVLMYGENNSTDKFYLTPRNDTGKSFTLDHVGNGAFSGRVGISNSSPEQPITVGDTSDSQNYIQIKTSATGAAGLLFSDGASTNPAGYLYDHATNSMQFKVNGSERMRLSGSTLDVGRGTVADATVLIDSASGGDPTLVFDTGATNRSANIRFKDQGTISGFINYHHQYDRMDFGSGSSTEIGMSLTDGGNLLVGTTSQTAQLTVNNGGNNYPSWLQNSSSSIDYPNRVISSYATGGQTATMFLFLAANGDAVGSIKSTVTTTSYNTSSDYRLKKNIEDADDAGSKIDAIQVRKYDWKADGSHQDYGMIAQELQTVAPEAVSGDADSEEMMGVDYSKLVPMLIKEIQSLRNRVAQLEE